MPKSDLPFGSEFSPNQIDLPTVLELIAQHSGDKEGLEKVIKDAFFKDNKTSERNKQKLAMNLRLSLKAYQIIDDDIRFTDFGELLYQLRDADGKLYAELAKHILFSLHGLTLVQCIQDMEASGEKVDLVKLREWLQERGIHFPRGGKHPSMMRLWLEKAGVFAKGWRVNEARLIELTGIASEELDALVQLTPEQKAFIKALVNQGEQESYFSNDIEQLASATYGVKFNEKMLPKTVLYPLRDAGYITLERGTKSPGRGAKPFLVYPTEKLRREVVLPVLEQLEQQVHSDLRPLLRKPLAEILNELDDKSTHIRGLALEALAFKLMRIIDLNYVATRLRGSMTGGAEVDLIFESSRLVFSRWQIQCKNTSSIRLDDVAKEVGLMTYFGSKVAVIISTGRASREAQKYAELVRNEYGKQVIYFIFCNPETVRTSYQIMCLGKTKNTDTRDLTDLRLTPKKNPFHPGNPCSDADQKAQESLKHIISRLSHGSVQPVPNLKIWRFNLKICGESTITAAFRASKSRGRRLYPPQSPRLRGTFKASLPQAGGREAGGGYPLQG